MYHFTLSSPSLPAFFLPLVSLSRDIRWRLLLYCTPRPLPSSYFSCGGGWKKGGKKWELKMTAPVGPKNKIMQKNRNCFCKREREKSTFFLQKILFCAKTKFGFSLFSCGYLLGGFCQLEKSTEDKMGERGGGGGEASFEAGQ